MEGLYHKYEIVKTDGQPIDPHADYFVLRIDEDPHAVDAVLAYALACASSNPNLTSDLIRKVRHYAPEKVQGLVKAVADIVKLDDLQLEAELE